jgi:hypothetical protein
VPDGGGAAAGAAAGEDKVMPAEGAGGTSGTGAGAGPPGRPCRPRGAAPGCIWARGRQCRRKWGRWGRCCVGRAGQRPGTGPRPRPRAPGRAPGAAPGCPAPSPTRSSGPPAGHRHLLQLPDTHLGGAGRLQACRQVAEGVVTLLGEGGLADRVPYEAGLDTGSHPAQHSTLP